MVTVEETSNQVTIIGGPSLSGLSLVPDVYLIGIQDTGVNSAGEPDKRLSWESDVFCSIADFSEAKMPEWQAVTKARKGNKSRYTGTTIIPLEDIAGKLDISLEDLKEALRRPRELYQKYALSPDAPRRSVEFDQRLQYHVKQSKVEIPSAIEKLKDHSNPKSTRIMEFSGLEEQTRWNHLFSRSRMLEILWMSCYLIPAYGWAYAFVRCSAGLLVPKIFNLKQPLNPALIELEEAAEAVGGSIRWKVTGSNLKFNLTLEAWLEAK